MSRDRRRGPRESRRLPRWSEIAPLLASAPRDRDPVRRRLARAHDIEDLREMARRRTPRSVFDYVDGGAETESTRRRNASAFDDVEFLPQVLRDVSRVDPGTTILGRPVSMPFVFAPTGFTRMVQHEGEAAVARVAEREGVPYALSTMGTISPEDLAAAAPGADRWFQLYVWRDRAASRRLLERAAAAGFTTLVVTVAVAVAGARLRDLRSGMTIPPTLILRTLAGIARRPRWWIDVVTHEPLRFAALEEAGGGFAEVVDGVMDPGVDFGDLEWMREHWSGDIVVKGVLHPRDARTVVDCGVQAVAVSNHGGRQLDRAASTLAALPEVRAAVGTDAEVYLNGGVRSGTDLAAALAHGADAVLVGRPYLYGLMAGGEQGVSRVHDLYRQGFLRALALLGVTSVGELGPHLLRCPPAHGPRVTKPVE